MKSKVNEVFLTVRLSVTSGYSVSFIVPFDCILELFAAERTNVVAFNCNLWYSLISFQVSVYNILSVAPESSRKSICRNHFLMIGRLLCLHCNWVYPYIVFTGDRKHVFFC